MFCKPCHASASFTLFTGLPLFRLHVTTRRFPPWAFTPFHDLGEGFIVSRKVGVGECPAVTAPISEIVGQKEEREEDPLLIFSAFSLDPKIVVRGCAHQNYYSIGEEKWNCIFYRHTEVSQYSVQENVLEIPPTLEVECCREQTEEHDQGIK